MPSQLAPFLLLATLQITLVDMIPAWLSDESQQDSEPNLAVKLSDPQVMAASALTPGAGPLCAPDMAPIFVSIDQGRTWDFNCIVPSDARRTTADITLRFGGSTLYAAILRLPTLPPGGRLNILSTSDPLGSSPMTVLVDRTDVDQPYLDAGEVPSGPDAGKHRVYVAWNDGSQWIGNNGNGKTAMLDFCLDGVVANPSFASQCIEVRDTGTSDESGLDLGVRSAMHSDGTVYGVFYRLTDGTETTFTADIVVVRDDQWGTGSVPFSDLKDSLDGLSGRRIVRNEVVPYLDPKPSSFGQQRLTGSNLSIAVDPGNSATVYVAWADEYADKNTLHVRRSTDRGKSWSLDLRRVTRATNPALAIDALGRVGFLYQRLSGGTSLSKQIWETHFELTADQFNNRDDFVLAKTPAGNPTVGDDPYLGDYLHLLAVGNDFCGVFSASNEPDKTHFPRGVTYQRNVDWETQTLLGTATGSTVAISIDPFFFHVQDVGP